MAHHTIIVLDADQTKVLVPHVRDIYPEDAAKTARRKLRKLGLSVNNFTKVDVTAQMTLTDPEDTFEYWVANNG